MEVGGSQAGDRWNAAGRLLIAVVPIRLVLFGSYSARSRCKPCFFNMQGGDGGWMEGGEAGWSKWRGEVEKAARAGS